MTILMNEPRGKYVQAWRKASAFAWQGRRTDRRSSAGTSNSNAAVAQAPHVAYLALSPEVGMHGLGAVAKTTRSEHEGVNTDLMQINDHYCP